LIEHGMAQPVLLFQPRLWDHRIDMLLKNCRNRAIAANYQLNRRLRANLERLRPTMATALDAMGPGASADDKSMEVHQCV